MALSRGDGAVRGPPAPRLDGAFLSTQEEDYSFVTAPWRMSPSNYTCDMTNYGRVSRRTAGSRTASPAGVISFSSFLPPTEADTAPLRSDGEAAGKILHSNLT